MGPVLGLSSRSRDGSFVQAMGTDVESATIVQSVLALAKSLGLPAIAEGIEHSQARTQIMEGGGECGLGSPSPGSSNR